MQCTQCETHRPFHEYRKESRDPPVCNRCYDQINARSCNNCSVLQTLDSFPKDSKVCNICMNSGLKFRCAGCERGLSVEHFSKKNRSALNWRCNDCVAEFWNCERCGFEGTEDCFSEGVCNGCADFLAGQVCVRCGEQKRRCKFTVENWESRVCNSCIDAVPEPFDDFEVVEKEELSESSDSDSSSDDSSSEDEVDVVGGGVVRYDPNDLESKLEAAKLLVLMAFNVLNQ